MLDHKINDFFFRSNITFDEKKFRTTLLHDFNATFNAAKEVPDLLCDFQFILDYKGNVWQMDLDRIQYEAKDKGNLAEYLTVTRFDVDNFATLMLLNCIDKVTRVSSSSSAAARGRGEDARCI